MFLRALPASLVLVALLASGAIAQTPAPSPTATGAVAQTPAASPTAAETVKPGPPATYYAAWGLIALAGITVLATLGAYLYHAPGFRQRTGRGTAG